MGHFNPTRRLRGWITARATFALEVDADVPVALCDDADAIRACLLEVAERRFFDQCHDLDLESLNLNLTEVDHAD